MLHAVKRRTIETTVEELVIRWKGACYILSTNSNEVFIRNSYSIFQPIENFSGSHFEACGVEEVFFFFLVTFQPFLIGNN
jgi:hypothetical protein